MPNRSTHNNETQNRITYRSTVLALLVITFFVLVIFIYYRMLYNEKRDNIIANGRISVGLSSDQLDKYLSTNLDSIRLAAYSLDGMLEENRSDAEIQDYLVSLSTAIRSAVNENSTGLYGYINGKFFSGTNWVPPEGYDATIRPWYTKPIENPGEITILDPYHDVQSGNTMLALGKTLCDGVSVISVDVSLEQVQNIMEDAVTTSDADMEMILNDKGVVVAHSDSSEVGKNYEDEEGTFGATVFDALDGSKSGVYEISFEDSNYIAYVAPIRENWCCISVMNATETLASLNSILIFTIIIVIVIVAILSIIMTRSKKRSIIAHEAIAASEAKSAFLSRMSHEIRTPINAVLGMNEMVLRESDDENVIEYANNISTAGHHLLSIINDILDFSKIESGKMEIVSVRYDLSKMLVDLVNMIQPRVQEKALALTLDFDKNIPRELLGDEIHIKQVITNILTNAVKYTEKGGVIFYVGYEKTEDDPDGIMLNVIVKDTGIGIKPEDMSRLFSEFERIEEDRNRNIEGTGLGMSITKSLLEMMGSTLTVESEYGLGSKFGFKIRQKVMKWEPLGDCEATFKESVKKQERYKEKFTAPTAEVLVVDDNPMNLFVFKSLLKQTKMLIDTAESGAEAVDLTTGKKYDIIFMDHMMPEMDGVETMKKIKSLASNKNSGTPVVCLTANALTGARADYIAQGFDDYMSKPIDPAYLEDILMKYLPKEKISKTQDKETADQERSEESASQHDGKNDLPTFLYDIRELNADAGLQQNGSCDVYLGTLKLFVQTADSYTGDIGRFTDSGDMQNASIKVHALKSSLRIIGAAELGETAQKIETACKNDDKETLKNELDNFLSCVNSLKEKLLPVTGDDEDANSSGADAYGDVNTGKDLDTIYAEIREFAADCDNAGIEELLEKLQSMELSDSDRDRVNRIAAACKDFDFDAVSALVS